MNQAGKMSDEKRNEGLLLTDILGLESLIDEITHTLAEESGELPTNTAILGPFWRKDAPIRKMGDTIVFGIDDGDNTLMSGKVLDYSTGKPIANAEIDVWHTAPNGLYESQDPNQPDMNLRGRFYTGDDGNYHFYCLRPTSYPIPDDGPAGKLLHMLDRHPMRPACVSLYHSHMFEYHSHTNWRSDTFISSFRQRATSRSSRRFSIGEMNTSPTTPSLL